MALVPPETWLHLLTLCSMKLISRMGFSFLDSSPGTGLGAVRMTVPYPRLTWGHEQEDAPLTAPHESLCAPTGASRQQPDPSCLSGHPGLERALPRVCGCHSLTRLQPPAPLG